MKFQGFREFAKYGGLQIREEDCSYVWQVPVKLRCGWVNDTAKCRSSSSIQYTKILFCTFTSESAPLFATGSALLFLWLLYLFLILGTTADNFFCPSLSTIATVLHLSESIAGVTILAFGNGAPDIFTSLVSSQDAGIIMFTELMGAGVFVTAIIAGSVAIAVPFKIYPKFFIRDCTFYIIALSWIVAVIWDDMVYLWEAISLIVLYVLYIVVVVLMQMYDSREEKRKRRIPGLSDTGVLKTFLANQKQPGAMPWIPHRSRAYSLEAKLDVAIARELEKVKSQGNTLGQEAMARETTSERPTGLLEEFFYDLNPINGKEWRNGNIRTKFLLIIRSPFMLILQLFIPVVNETAEKRGWSKLLNCLQLSMTPNLILYMLDLWHIQLGPVPLIVIVGVSSHILSTTVFFLTKKDEIPKYHNVFAFAGFLAAMLFVYTVAQEVMSVLECIGFASSISEAMLGITFLTWGNSVGDLISNLTIAKKGFPRMGFAACFGGPMFNTLLGLGLSYGIAAGKMAPDFKIKIRTSDMSPGCLAFLFSSLVISMIYLNLTGFRARRSYGFLLCCLYAAFMIINVLSEIHFIHPLGTDHRADEFDIHRR